MRPSASSGMEGEGWVAAAGGAGAATGCCGDPTGEADWAQREVAKTKAKTGERRVDSGRRNGPSLDRSLHLHDRDRYRSFDAQSLTAIRTNTKSAGPAECASRSHPFRKDEKNKSRSIAAATLRQSRTECRSGRSGLAPCRWVARYAGSPRGCGRQCDARPWFPPGRQLLPRGNAR